MTTSALKFAVFVLFLAACDRWPRNPSSQRIRMITAIVHSMKASSF
jgi:hypothetical protein